MFDYSKQLCIYSHETYPYRIRLRDFLSAYTSFAEKHSVQVLPDGVIRGILPQFTLPSAYCPLEAASVQMGRPSNWRRVEIVGDDGEPLTERGVSIEGLIMAAADNSFYTEERSKAIRAWRGVLLKLANIPIPEDWEA